MPAPLTLATRRRDRRPARAALFTPETGSRDSLDEIGRMKPMKTRAAVAFAAKKPLEIVEIDLEGPKAGEVLVEVKATGICHTDYYTLSGADPEGLFPCRPGPRGRGRGGGCRPGRDDAEEGRPRHSALHARMPPVQKLPVAQDESVHRHPRDAGQGRDARRHQPLQVRWRARAALHGHVDLRQPHRRARDRAGENPARTRPSTRSATSAAASPPASAR